MAHRRSWRTALITLTAALAAVLVTAPTANAAPYCGITWGSLDKTDYSMIGGYLTGVRAGRHDCYDRLVFDAGGAGVLGYAAYYVPTVIDPANNRALPTRGGAYLWVEVPVYVENAGVPTYTTPNPAEAVNVTGYRTFRQVRHVGGMTTFRQFAIGVRARLPFRVINLGDRLVVDVAHQW
ncbi:AMIN-like domain-containing (lipo)protein [Actinokineospora inagensis]|uniref:AMIN-like domain-containing (lipo)protein n=1 Tax=Actinokineospora inagensis TaxID=103730 RepID=UPI00041E3496|nr:hypothetical protein [Actinokineospora inagensis]